MKYLKRCNHRIRAACFDLDGTLIDERNGRVPPDAQSAIKQIKGERKIYFATGRNLAEIPMQVLELPFNGFVLLSGLVTYIKPDANTAPSLKNREEFQGFRKLNAFPIEWEKVESVLAWVYQTGLSAVFYLLDQIFILSSDKKIEQVGLNPNWGEVYHFSDYQSFVSMKPEVFRIEVLIPKGCSEDVLKSFDRDEVTELEGKMYSLKKRRPKEKE